tara:strand:+ start:36 stop:863 length:828 start_codon:yes stop_codon:yes gene_type:complete
MKNWSESKEERKLRKAGEKALRALADQDIGLQQSYIPLATHQNYILCLKHGSKYGPEYVNTLYNMVKRHCTIDYTFVCLTENANGLDPNILIRPLPEYLSGWWCKPYMFSNKLELNGTILYMDLDVVIANNIDHLFTFEEGHWCTIRDFTRKMRPGWKKYNSSVVRFKNSQLTNVWESFKNNKEEIERKFHGDQDWLYHVTNESNPAKLFPDEWIQSWKWEIRQTKDFKAGGGRGNRQLRTIENVVPPNNCCITVFHGDPNPNNCKDPWVVDNWR